MTIQSAIENAQQKVANAYTAVSGKGGTLPSTQNLSNLPTAINSIQTGGGGATLSYSWYLDDYEILNYDYELEADNIFQLLENDYTPDYDFVDCTFTFIDANGNDFSYNAGGYSSSLVVGGTETYDDDVWATSYIIELNPVPGSGNPEVGPVAAFNLYIEKNS